MKGKKIEFKSATCANFMSWLLDKKLWYGEPWVQWWKEFGSEAFTKWNIERIRKDELITENREGK